VQVSTIAPGRKVRFGRMLAGGAVPCSGHRINPDNASPEFALLWVPPGTRQCPLTWNLEVMGY
jgi:hypothetical protein